MRAMIAAGMLLLVLVSGAVGQTASCPALNTIPRPYDSETLTVSSQVKTLTASVYAQTIAQPDGTERTAVPRFAEISTAGGSMNYFVDGSTPSSTVGHTVTAGTPFTICGPIAVAQFKGIAVSDDVTITVTYWEAR